MDKLGVPISIYEQLQPATPAGVYFLVNSILLAVIVRIIYWFLVSIINLVKWLMLIFEPLNYELVSISL